MSKSSILLVFLRHIVDMFDGIKEKMFMDFKFEIVYYIQKEFLNNK